MKRKFLATLIFLALIILTVLNSAFFTSKPPKFGCYVVSGTGDTTLVFSSSMHTLNIHNEGSNRCRYSLHYDSNTYPSIANGDSGYTLGAGSSHNFTGTFKALVLHRASATSVIVVAEE